jgi:hypothetical protein
MNDLRTAAKQALEALEGGAIRFEAPIFYTQAITALRVALEQPEQTCNCRWVGDVQTQQCTLHEAHVDAIHEWAERAKAAEAKLTALEQPEQADLPEEKLQAVAEHVGDKYHVWYGIGARDVEEVLCQSARLGLVTLDSNTSEQLEQEPVAVCEYCEKERPVIHAPRREWRGLTEEEIEDCWYGYLSDYQLQMIRAIEAKLKELNHE